LSQFFDLTFDPSVHDIFAAWKVGATSVAIPSRHILDPLEFARERGITVWFSGPSVPIILDNFRAARAGALPDVRLSLFAGEKLTWNAARIWKTIAPSSAIVNAYGPTEATIVITSFTIPDGFSEADCHQGGVPIGKPFAGQTTAILHEDGSPCRPGEEGVLWLAGSQISPGYLDPEKTALSFVERDGRRWYRTGDVVVGAEDGNISYVGRQDLQMKVLGFRVDLGEIEAALLEESGAAFAFVDVARLRDGFEELVCVLPTSCAPRKKAIREALKSQLEPYMIPKVWKFQDDLPLNPNGKIDRAAIKAGWLAEASREI
jgi:non-ribosomal peptide synthetase component F